MWVAGTAAQLGAVPIRPPLSQLFAVQVAASVVNQVVPGSVGGMAVNVRYLQRSGMSRAAALAAVGLNSVATMVTHLALHRGRLGARPRRATRRQARRCARRRALAAWSHRRLVAATTHLRRELA